MLLAAGWLLAAPDVITRTRQPPPGAGWRGVRVASPASATALRRALDDAARRLGDEDCRRLLDDFSDEMGRPLSARLTQLGVDSREYLAWIQFHDGTSSFCADGSTLMYTVPGSRVVNVCKVAIESSGPAIDYLSASVLHEMLHTLGLGENPPSSAEITGRIKRSCWGRSRPTKERLPELEALELAGGRARQLGAKLDDARALVGRGMLADERLQLGDELGRPVAPGVHHDERLRLKHA